MTGVCAKELVTFLTRNEKNTCNIQRYCARRLGSCRTIHTTNKYMEVTPHYRSHVSAILNVINSIKGGSVRARKERSDQPHPGAVVATHAAS
jgi:hypothetical protein